jgi:hypothetical protein
MNISDLKVGMMNAVAFFMAFAKVDAFLQTLLLILSIVYTLVRIRKTIIENKKNENTDR